MPKIKAEDANKLLNLTKPYFDQSLQKQFGEFLQGKAKLVKSGKRGRPPKPEEEVPVIDFREQSKIGNPSVSGMGFGTDYGIYNPSTLTVDTIMRMKKDQQIASALAFIKLPLLAIPWRIVCSNERISKTVEYIIKKIWRSTLRSTLTAIEFGFASHEKVFAVENIKVVSINTEEGADSYFEGPALIYKKIKPHYPDSVTLKVDQFDNFAGIEQFVVGGDKVDLPANKCFLFSNDYEFGNYYGRSRLESAYKYWYWKEIMYQFMLMYYERRGSPSVVATAPLGESTSADGKTRRANLDVALDLAANLLSNSVAAVPYQADKISGQNAWGIQYLSDDKRGEMFINAIDHLDKAILHALFIPDNTISEGKSYSSASVHADLFLITEKGLVTDIEDAVNKQLIPILVQANFKPEEWCDCFLEMENLDFNRKIALKEIFIEQLRNIDNMIQIGLRPKIMPNFEEIAKILQVPVSTIEDIVKEEGLEVENIPEKEPTKQIPAPEKGVKTKAVPRRTKRKSSAGSREVDRQTLRPSGKAAENLRKKY